MTDRDTRTNSAAPNLGRAKQLAIKAVAGRFRADWQIGPGPPDASATIGGRRIALDVATIAQGPSRRPFTNVRLREDVVAQRVLRDLKSALHEQVPNGKTIIFTLGAPIMVPKKMVDALTKLLLGYLQSGRVECEEKKTLLGNRVRFRVLSRNLPWKAKVIGFVFSGDPKPGVLADAMRSLHDQIAAIATRPLPPESADERWLVLSSDRWLADIKTYRLAYAQLSPFAFKKVLILCNGGRVELLSGS